MPLPNELRPLIPSVDKLLGTREITEAIAMYPRWAVLQEVRAVIEEVRAGTIPLVTDPGLREAWLASLAEEAARRAVGASGYSLRHVVNATGVVLHTNLGRARLAPAAIEHLVAVATRYTNLELELATGERGHRYDHVRELVRALTGAEDAIVVNNNAAAVLLCLSALAAGKQVIVSRGELVEIGGSFRIPDIMAQSGCQLVEVGTTNRTHLADYEHAVTPQTALLLKVHTSNFRVVGFTAAVGVDELIPLAREHGLPIMNDLGAGCLVQLRDLGLPHEPTVQDAVKQGADLVTFSGDKLLGGPQLGVIAGKREIVKRLEKHPLLRALRVDKLTLAAFEATLRIYRDARDPIAELPSLRMLRIDAATIKQRAEAFVARLVPRLAAGTEVSVQPGSSQVGAGSAPGVDLPTFLVVIQPHATEVATIEARLRQLTPAVMVRVHGGDLLVDLRTVDVDEESILLEALATSVR
ncbi:MAG: L-seryl-tRNA(Sec) selenium transferase [Deltaproteobacteria bacterium]|nr:L-seryl-tRNA(Sec) selenium transferase [Deltaproteobacteria bacterium]